MTKPTPTTLAAFLCIYSLIAVAAWPSRADSTAPSTAPTTRPLADLLTGTYQGQVVDDDELVTCVTRFETYRGKVSGEYVVREGRERYRGTLTQFKLVDAENRICRFHWKDKHGEGLLTIQVTPDGASFAGSWGKQFVQDELIWKGTRQDPTTRRSESESSSAGDWEERP